MNDQYAPRISVIDPVDSAFDRVKLILFQPFDLGKWFAIGFCAWLVELCTNLANYCKVTIRIFGASREPEEIQQLIASNRQEIIIIAPIIAGVIFIALIIFWWLGNRGRFMFLHCLANNNSEVKAPWSRYSRQGNSLFLFRLVLLFIFLFCLGLGIGTGSVLAMISGRGDGSGAVLLLAILIPLLLIPLSIIYVVIDKFTVDFVAPIMYLHGLSCMESWSHFMQLLSANKGRFLLYILFQILIAIVILAILFAVFCVTCCFAGVLMLIPYVGTLLVLPILAFKRAYSLYYIRQFGAAYDVFDRLAPQPEPEPEPAPQAYPAVEPEPEPDDNPYRPPDVTGL